MDLTNIYQNKETDTYFLADWSKFTSKAPTFQRLSSAIETKRQAQKNFSQEVSKLGSMLLVLHGVDPKYLEALVEANKSTELNNVIDGLNISEALKKLLKRMFSKDLNSRPTLGELINLPISSQVNQPEEYKKADDVGQQKDGKDDNGIPFSFAKALGSVTPNQNDKVSHILSRLGEFKYTEDETKDPYLGPYEICGNGAIYIGQWKDGKRHGRGTQIWPNGARFEGHWKNDKAQGKGRFIHENGDVYEGDFVNDRANGKGVFIHTNGVKYEGEWLEDLQHGMGIETWPDGSFYNGSYSKGKKRGKGVYTWADGSRYEGEWKNNCIDGIGVYNFADGRRYEGSWENNMMHGEGTYSWADGRKYIGNYVNHKRHGHGTFIWADGRKYVGEWKDGVQHGIGVYTDGSGVERKGEWVEGKRTRWL